MQRIRVALVALASAALLAGAAWAEPPRPEAGDGKPEAREQARPRYTSTLERWRGRPALRSAARTHPLELSGSEVVYEHLPSVNFLLEGQHGGAFGFPGL